MKCPLDGAELVMTERAGVEIDYCPQCRGVWLDRGELDKIIERSAPPAAPQQRVEPQAWQEEPQTKHRKKKRGGFLEDLFDF
ncbi:zf-TFIIB domain-containing protein [Roseovarius sp. EL26]|uniref:TFIIB-type zinc ribbon-containing protein n=1 Tax=Roseovarius sp. EL26 TaxID=2126672 RepID=UPI000EA1943A|nr:zf-TFIIB domain-containing protein [Roseovarius sp. EL26]